ncbi:murein transglycosylase A [Nitratidesulfovibrio sp. SRB-5]|uniref:murein transglycosylase A n=1 Tax=Nitratidesulfovibrio sp. SRB-5 TaxID=2872636 RepID=UPI001CBA6925|nr:murein transglycosylase A [Nitratidesulfovibrio sp. SRB-5]
MFRNLLPRGAACRFVRHFVVKAKAVRGLSCSMASSLSTGSSTAPSVAASVAASGSSAFGRACAPACARAAGALLLALVISGCASHAPRIAVPEPEMPPAVQAPAPARPALSLPPLPAYTEASPDEIRAAIAAMDPRSQGLASWNDLAPALAQSLSYMGTRPAGGVALDRSGVRVTNADFMAALRQLSGLLPQLDANPGLLAQRFRWLRVDTAWTGYYEPVLRASRTPAPGYPHPIYRTPPDMQVTEVAASGSGKQRMTYRVVNGPKGRTLRPYYDRAEIDAGALRGKGLELAWAADPVDVYILQVQGSGRVRFTDGSEARVLYAAQNGRPYVSIGRILKERGELPPDGVNMPAIRQWLENHPAQARELMNTNPSYVFFRMEEGRASGPLGCTGRPLTPWVSLATDRSVLPSGALVAFSAPVPQPAGGGAVTGLGLAQDTGGAIKGYRIDLFCGAGDRAAAVAGHLDAPGPAWLLLPRNP